LTNRYDIDRTWPNDPEREILRTFARRGDLTEEEQSRFESLEHISQIVGRYTEERSMTVEEVAIHESGHAVVADYVGFTVKEVRILQGDAENAGMTHADLIVVDGPELPAERVQRITSVAMNQCSGYIAEELAFGPTLEIEMWEVGEGLQNDLRLTPQQRETLVTMVEDKSREVLRQHWAAVEAIAEELQTNGRVDGAFVEQASRACEVGQN
jgi:hypothetical protein